MQDMFLNCSFFQMLISFSDANNRFQAWKYSLLFDVKSVLLGGLIFIIMLVFFYFFFSEEFMFELLKHQSLEGPLNV